MKIKIILSVAVVLMIAALIASYVQMSQERKSEANDDTPIAAESRMQTGSNGQTIVILDSKAQDLIGLQTATLTAATLPPESKAYGRVLDSAALVALHGETVAAQAAAQAAQREYERLKTLSAQDNTSARALETAEAEMKRDQSLLATAAAQLVAASARAVADEPPGFFQSLARQESVLVRLDLPAGETLVETPVAARFILPGTEQAVVADFLGRAATTDPQAQGAGFLFVATNAPATLAPGLAVAGLLRLPGAPSGGVIVPDSAVVRSDGHAWIYIQTTDTAFARREILLDRPAATGWFITQGAAPGDKVVVTGAQTLLSEEHKSEIQIGD